MGRGKFKIVDESEFDGDILITDPCYLMHGGKSDGPGLGSTRPSRDILDELSKKVVELEGLRDSEWDFADKNGHDPAFWSDCSEKEHDEILANIQKCREEVSRLVREATGDDTISV